MTYPAQVTQLKELPDVLAVSDRRIKQPPRISELAPCRQNGPNSAVYSNEFAGLLVELGPPSVDAGISAIRRYRQTEDSHHSATLFGGAMACLLAAGISVAMWLSISANNTESLQTAGQTAFVDAEREVPDAPQSPKALPASIHRASSVLQAAVDGAPIRPRMPVIQTAAYSTDAPTSQSEAETFPKSSTPDETAVASSNSNDFPPHPAGRAEQMERPPDSRRQTEPEEGDPISRPSAGYESERDPKGRSPQTQLTTIRTASNTVASEISPPSEQSAEDSTATKDNSNSADLGPSDSADSKGTSDGSSADAEAASGPKGGKSSKSGKNTQSAGSDSSESNANGNSQSQESSASKEKKGKPSKGSSSQSGSRDTADAPNSRGGGNKGQSSKDADGKGKGTRGSDGKGHKGEGK